MGATLSLFVGFVIVYTELKNDFMGRLGLNFGDVYREFGGLSPLAPTFVEHSVTTFFNNLV